MTRPPSAQRPAGATETTAKCFGEPFTEAELRALLENSGDVILLLDKSGRFIKVAGGAHSTLAAPSAAAIGRTVAEMLEPDVAKQCQQAIDAALAGEPGVQLEYPLQLRRECRYYRARVHALAGQERVLWVARDITEHRAADRALAERYETERLLGRLSGHFINVAPDCIDDVIDQALRDMGEYFEVERAYVYRFTDGARYMVNCHGWHTRHVASRLGYGKRVATADFPWLMDVLQAGEVISLSSLDDLPAEAHKERTTFVQRGAKAAILVPIMFSGSVHGFIGFDSAEEGRDWPVAHVQFVRAFGEVFASALQRKHSEETIYRLAYYDELTQLPNRSRLNQLLAAATEDQSEPFVMTLLDLDDCSTFNDLLGHSLGDELLLAVSKRLKQLTAEGHTLGRWGGDEFINTAAAPATTEETLAAARKIQAALAEPMYFDGQEIRISCCVGMARYPEDAKDVEGLIRCAEMALHQAKTAGRGSVHRYTRKLKETASRRNLMQSRLRLAVDNGDFTLNYQPLVTAKEGRIVGAEALIRWHDEKLGQVGPDQFIPVAEESGLISAIGEWVLRKACEELKHWRNGSVPRISINVSGLQLLDRRLNTTLDAVIREQGLDPAQLELELTESALMERETAGLPFLSHLRELGMGIAVDDFGTGYSSLAKIKHMPVNVLKIDRSFIKDIFTDINDRAIVVAILAIARQMQLKVVAEGVETAEQLAFLRENGCDLIQGYLYSRPLPAEEFRQLWARGTLTIPELDGEPLQS